MSHNPSELFDSAQMSDFPQRPKLRSLVQLLSTATWIQERLRRSLLQTIGPMASISTVHCVWWDHACVAPDSPHSPLFQAWSHLPIETILFNVGKHLALGLYTLSPTFNAAPSTLTVIMTTAASQFSTLHIHLAFRHAVDPDFVSACTPSQLDQLLETGLIVRDPSDSSRFLDAPFPSLHGVSQSPVSGFNTPSPVAPSPPEVDSIGLHLLSVPTASSAPSSPAAAPYWSGARVGETLGFGPTSTPSYIVAALGRLIGQGSLPGKLVSIIATNGEVTIILEHGGSGGREEHEARLTVAFQLLQGGGVPWSEALRARAVALGLLDGEAA